MKRILWISHSSVAGIHRSFWSNRAPPVLSTPSQFLTSLALSLSLTLSELAICDYFASRCASPWVGSSREWGGGAASTDGAMGTVDEKLIVEKAKKNGDIVAVNPKPKKGLVSKTVDLIERVLVYLMYDSKAPLHYLSGNFAPAREETPPARDLPVRGSLPVSPFPKNLSLDCSYFGSGFVNARFGCSYLRFLNGDGDFLSQSAIVSLFLAELQYSLVDFFLSKKISGSLCKGIVDSNL